MANVNSYETTNSAPESINYSGIPYFVRLFLVTTLKMIPIVTMKISINLSWRSDCSTERALHASELEDAHYSA